MRSEQTLRTERVLPATPANSVRMVTWNLWHDDVERLARAEIVGRTLAALGAQIVTLQELTPTSMDDVLATICAHSSLRVITVSGGAGDHTVTAVLSTLPGRGETPIACTTPVVEQPYHAAVATLDTPGGGRVRVCSAHLAWGGLHESARLDQAVALHHALQARCGTDGTDGCVLAGDFNAVPASATLRYLTGLEPHAHGCAQWTDAWTVCGDGPGWTSVPENVWARTTATTFGFLRPELLPRRRIDYVLVHGYAYGRLYTPLQCATVDGSGGSAPYPGSDHAAVVVDLYDPRR